VVSSQFLLDSDASLRGTLLRLTPETSEMDTDKPAMPATAQTMGTVVSLMADHGMITVDHGPIEALDWPAMIMEFRTESENLKNIKTGDHINITVQAQPDENGNYTLTKIEKMQMPEIDGETKQ